MKSDVEIALDTPLIPISEIASSLGIKPEELEPYGRYKAKLNDSLFKRVSENQNGKLILVTAVNPTPAGEGKTTTTIGLGQALARSGRSSIICLREPSLGPVFGVKGGAAGGGYSQVLPMEDINLHFTGDFHAITSANNLLCAMIDNHIYQGNALSIDPKRIVIKRVLDMNDRALRSAVIGLGAKTDGVVREESFMITVASEIMAILCLAADLHDLKERIASMIVAYKYTGEPVFCRELGAQGAMTVLLKDAIMPNLVQTTEHSPCLIHGGPFANIAHGCNSVRATRLALKLCDYVVTEAGFGADLGAEKFFDIKCRLSGLKPSAVVLVATLRALKYNGGIKKENASLPDRSALEKGLCNLEAHIENLKKFGVNIVVALNHFDTDPESEIEAVRGVCESRGCGFAVSKAYAEGGAGAAELAEKAAAAADSPSDFKLLYEDSASVKDKIEAIAHNIYGAAAVEYDPAASAVAEQIEKMGYSSLPVCMAKTQYSLSDDPSALGRPAGFTLHIREIRVSAGAGFIVCITGKIMTLPGLPKKPAAESIDIDDTGRITGLF